MTGRWLPLAIGLVVGFLIGIALHGWPSRDFKGRIVSSDSDRLKPGKSGAHSAPAGDSQTTDALLSETDALRSEIASLNATIDLLREQVPARKTPDEKRSIAREIYRVFTRQGSAGTVAGGVDYFRIMESFRFLDDDAAEVFIAKYKERLTTNKEIDQVALNLLLVSGGEPAAAFLKERLQDPLASQFERDMILAHLGGVGSVVTSRRIIPIDDDLGNKAIMLASSPRMEDKCGGLGLLGAWQDARARQFLRGVLESEANPVIRSVAVRALGKCGDAQTFRFLSDYFNQVRSSGGRLGGAVEEAFCDAMNDILVKYPDAAKR